MANVDFLPRRLQTAFSDLSVSERVKALLALQGNPEYNAWWDDFHGDQLDAKYAASVGTGTQVVGVTAARGGTATLTTGASASDSAGLALGLHWDGSTGIYFAARGQVDDITTMKFELGLTDDAGSTDEATGAVNVKATPTFAATDCAVFVFDTDDDTNLTFVSNGGTTDANSDSALTLVNATYFIVEIVVSGGACSGYVNGTYVGGGNITAATDLTPWLFVMTRTTATRTLTVDWMACLGPRE